MFNLFLIIKCEEKIIFFIILIEIINKFMK